MYVQKQTTRSNDCVFVQFGVAILRVDEKTRHVPCTMKCPCLGACIMIVHHAQESDLNSFIHKKRVQEPHVVFTHNT